MATYPHGTPSTWIGTTWVKDNSCPRNGLYYPGDPAPVINFGSYSHPTPNTGATGYSVYDWWGNVVSTGSIDPSATSFTPATPPGGWKYGWYFVDVTGPTLDADVGYTVAATTITFIRDNSNFPRMPLVLSVPANAIYDEQPDLVGKAVLGMGPSRFGVSNVTNLTSGDTLANAIDSANLAAQWWINPAYADPARPRYQWSNFTAATYDSLALPATSGTYATVFCKDGTIDGSTVFVAIGAGSVSGAKITVYSPNASTLVETYDNLASPAAAKTAINGVSSYIFLWPNSGAPGTLAATAIGNAFFNGVKTVVSDLYPLGVTHFEGPANEFLSASNGGLIAQEMKLFAAAVKAGNASAKAIGPCSVAINSSRIQGWKDFFAAGGGDSCDEFATHAYNSPTQGVLTTARPAWETWLALIDQYGYGSKPIWQTEANNVILSVSGCFMPRRSRVSMYWALLLEQYGIPREKNPPWYDIEHFYGYPAWWQNNDFSLQPQAAMYRVLAEETWGQTHNQKLVFGTVGDNIFLGSVYASASGKTAVLTATSAMANASATLSVTDTGTLTVIDAFGNGSTVTVVDGLVKIPLSEIPTYVRLSAGCTVSVHSCNDWPPVDASPIVSVNARPTMVGSSHPSVVPNDQQYFTDYSSQTGILGASASSTDVPPITASMSWENATRMDRVIVFCSSPLQATGTLIDFDVQTSVDGVTWVTQKTVTKTPPATANGFFNACWLRSFWDEQWIFDVKFDAPVTCKAMRLNVRSCSYGGMPDSGSYTATSAYGVGSATHLTLQEIVCLSDESAYPIFLAA